MRVPERFAKSPVIPTCYDAFPKSPAVPTKSRVNTWILSGRPDFLCGSPPSVARSLRRPALRPGHTPRSHSRPRAGGCRPSQSGNWAAPCTCDRSGAAVRCQLTSRWGMTLSEQFQQHSVLIPSSIAVHAEPQRRWERACARGDAVRLVHARISGGAPHQRWRVLALSAYPAQGRVRWAGARDVHGAPAALVVGAGGDRRLASRNRRRGGGRCSLRTRG